jgi:hypothetical protein
MHRACKRSSAEGNCLRINDSRSTDGNGNQHTLTSKHVFQGMLVLVSSEVLQSPLPSVAAPHIELQCNIYFLFSLSLSFWRVQYMGDMNKKRPTAVQGAMNHANTSFSTEV